MISGTSPRVGRIICPEGHVSSLNKSNPKHHQEIHSDLTSNDPYALLFPVPWFMQFSCINVACQAMHWVGWHQTYSSCRIVIYFPTIYEILCKNHKRIVSSSSGMGSSAGLKLSNSITWLYIDYSWFRHLHVHWYRITEAGVHFYPRPDLAFGYCRCLRLPVCVSVRVRQPLACPRDNAWPVSARITKFRP